MTPGSGNAWPVRLMAGRSGFMGKVRFNGKSLSAGRSSCRHDRLGSTTRDARHRRHCAGAVLAPTTRAGGVGRRRRATGLPRPPRVARSPSPVGRSSSSAAGAALLLPARGCAPPSVAPLPDPLLPSITGTTGQTGIDRSHQRPPGRRTPDGAGPERPLRSRRLPWVVGLVAVVIVAGGAGAGITLAVTNGSTTSSGSSPLPTAVNRGPRPGPSTSPPSPPGSSRPRSTSPPTGRTARTRGRG